MTRDKRQEVYLIVNNPEKMKRLREEECVEKSVIGAIAFPSLVDYEVWKRTYPQSAESRTQPMATELVEARV